MARDTVLVMTSYVQRHEGGPWDGSEARRQLLDEGLAPRSWSNGPADRYGWHRHTYHKVLYCVSGSIVFHTPDGDVHLGPGDRLDLPPGTDHAATVGPEGVECAEGARQTT